MPTLPSPYSVRKFGGNSKCGTGPESTFSESLTIGDASQHLISYYKIEDVEIGRLCFVWACQSWLHLKSEPTKSQNWCRWCPRKFPFSLKVASGKIQDSANKRSTPPVLPRAKEELRRTQRRLTCRTIFHKLRN